MQKKPQTIIMLAALAMLVSACGGGGSSGSGTAPTAPTAPSVQPSITISANPASVTAGQAVTITWDSQNTGASSCQASGAWSGDLSTAGSKQVTTQGSATPFTATYTLTCGSVAKSATVAVASSQGSNVVPVKVDSGPAASGRNINVPYVSVTVCQPGTTTCQTIDHVMVDTGSYGLRLFGPLDSKMNLPAVKSATGAAIGECGQFVSGYTWGSVVQADVLLGGELASSQSVQVVGDAPGGVSTAPTSCASVGNNIGTVAALGAKGILGVGLFKQDCGTACAATPISGTYYQCANGSCASTTMPLAQQVSNPVAAFASNNNGVILAFPAVANGGAQTLTGSLTFGIDTQSNNALSGAVKYRAGGSGVLSTTYKGTEMRSSFIDSGSNGLFFNDASLAKCSVSTDFYCPGSATSFSATITAYDGSASSVVPFQIEGVDQLGASVTAASIGAPYGSSKTFDWGLPFFFGRKVYIGMEGAAAAPYWAF